MKTNPAASPPPLTTSKRDGTLYRRRVDIDAAISLALSLPKDQWQDWAAKPPGAGRLPSEALVFLIRHVAATDRDLFGALVWQLNLRIGRIVKRNAQGFDPDTTDELIWGVERKIIDLILITPRTRQSDFLEVAFRLAVKRYTINAVEKRRNAPLPTPRSAALDDDETDADSATDQIADEAPHTEEIVAALQDRGRRGSLLRLAQRAVKDIRHYQAILLHHGFDWPFSSTDPSNQETLEVYFGMSERQIRNWIKDGLAAIRKALGENS